MDTRDSIKIIHEIIMYLIVILNSNLIAYIASKTMIFHILYLMKYNIQYIPRDTSEHTILRISRRNYVLKKTTLSFQD